MKLDRDTVRAALRAEDVANHLGIKSQWRGRWMRSRRCAVADHSSDAFALARDGMWHCWACDDGGDLLKLIALGERIDIGADFGRVLEVAAGIAGLEVEDDFGGPSKPAPIERPAPPPVDSIEKRLELARRRGKWVWERLRDRAGDHARARGGRLLSDSYLENERRLDVNHLRTREDYRDTPLIIPSTLDTSRIPDLEKCARLFRVPGVALAVRSPIDGAIVDIRVRRFEPKGDQPKIVGMLGGVTAAPAENGRGRELLGCYGFPHELERDDCVVVEGFIDYLTALCAFPTMDVLGAVDVGSLSLVAGVAAKAVARRSETGRVLIVEHEDGERLDKRTGKMVAGPGDRASNEEPNAATKVAIREIGPRRVGWMFCGESGAKDLNDLWRRELKIDPRWWADFGEAVA